MHTLCVYYNNMHYIVLQVKKLKQLMTLGGSEQPATGETKSSARDVPELTEEEAALLNISDSEGEDSEGVNDREEEYEQDTSSAEGSVQRELDRYLALTVKGARKAVRMRSRSVRNIINLDFDALQWWRDVGQASFPLLAKQARRFLCMQASSASVERIFSVAGAFNSKSRSKQSLTTLEKLVFVKTNQQWVQQQAHKLGIKESIKLY